MGFFLAKLRSQDSCILMALFERFLCGGFFFLLLFNFLILGGEACDTEYVQNSNPILLLFTHA